MRLLVAVSTVSVIFCRHFKGEVQLYFSEQTVFDAIDALSLAKFIGKQVNPDLLAFYLILKKLGVSENKWITKEKLYANKDLTLSAIYDLGGLFDETEDVGFKGCLFFSSFTKKDTLKEGNFFNAKTNFKSLPSRLKDTIDNSVVDHLLDKGMSDSYRLKIEHLTTIRNCYVSKLPLDSMLVWIYRHTDINGLSLNQLQALFFHTYNLNSDEMKKVFDFRSSISVSYQERVVKAQKIRTYLNANEYVEIIKTRHDYNFLTSLNSKTVEKIFINMNITKEKITELLNQHKQIILTGVPGTGKSYLIDEISCNYKKIKKIQFHQNYTYQQFIYGKTIQDGDVKTESGDLINFLEEVKNEKDNCLLFLDEINRGNISSIFGEALYILDRGNEIELENKSFSLPENLHIVGTMNSADRSIALIDFAIRRRFIFVELKPDYSILDKIAKINGTEILGDFLRKINDNIIKHFESEDFLLGHSYFLGVSSMTIDDVYDILHYKIIPILIEYAHGDRKVLLDIFPESILKSSSEELFEKINDFIDA